MASMILLRRLQDSYMLSVAPRRKVIETGPFVVLIDPISDVIYVNLALPVKKVKFTTEIISSMVATFQENDRLPRLEFFRDIWPTLPPALEAAGFELEKELPVLVCTLDTLRSRPASSVEVKLLEADDDLLPYFETGNAAYEADWPINEDRTQRIRDMIRNGVLRCAVGYIDGEAAGCACTHRFEGYCELAGVGTRPGFRNRGVASAVCSALLEDFFLTGNMAWLSATEDGLSVYRRLGFFDAGTQVNYSLAGRK